MREIAKQGLRQILQNHKNWLNDEGGKRANLSYANLWEADLSKADLSKADLSKAKGIISIQTQYKYQSYGYYYNNEMRVRLGCLDRTITEWDADFWNNDKEFPENSKQGENRFMIYTFYKTWLIANKEQEK